MLTIIAEEIRQDLSDPLLVISLIGSLIAGAFIGYEREIRRRSAGLRTHALVCFTAAFLTLLGLRMAQWSVALPPDTQIVSDMSRMPHAILTGVGFLGAGAIFRDGVNVQGLTTAAGLWLTAGLGIVFGTGMIGLALICTVIALLVLTVLRLLQPSESLKSWVKLEVALPIESEITLSQLMTALKDLGHRCKAAGFDIDSLSEGRLLHIEIEIEEAQFEPERIAAKVASMGEILSLSLRKS